MQPEPADSEVAALVAEARAEARDEVRARLRARFVDELLAQAEVFLSSGRPAAGLSLLGIVPADSERAGVASGNVKALVTELDPARLDDPQELERRVRSHTDMLLEALASGPVVPIRFGTLFPGEEALVGWLERNERALLAELERLRDCVEWGVKIELGSRAEPALVGAGAYLERRLAAGEEHARRSQSLAERADDWHGRLLGCSEAAVRDADRPFAAAYLVRTSRQAEFDAAVLDVSDELGGEHELSLTGPWPAYSFVPEALA